MISIIVPVYDVEPYIHQCIDSIINQTYKDLEILLIDDGSPDNCGAICDEYAKQDSRIRVFHTENKGLSAARNLGLKEAKGEYIGFVDSDDWIEPDMYEVLLRELEENEANVCICGHYAEYADKISALHPSKAVYTTEEAFRALLEWKYKSSVWNKLYQRECFRNITFPEGRYYEDIQTTLLVLMQSPKIVLISESEYHYRQYREGSISSNCSAKNLIDLAEARIFRFEFFRTNEQQIFIEKKDVLLQNTASGISRVWRRWHGCSKEEKKYYSDNLQKLMEFTKKHIPLFGNNSWPARVRLSAPFMHSNNKVLFAILYYVNLTAKRFKSNREHG